ncbi:MAG: hypothetical protein PQJ45_09790 [Sphaerochaetaceae bacterium]|nr:hypothetical protein [Sphaerochaetaceae bacterium]
MKKIYIIFIFSLLASFSLFAEQTVSSTAPEYESDITFVESSQTAYVIANAESEDFIADLYYDGSPLDDGTTISQTSDNEALLLTESWELSPFSILISGTDLEDFTLDIELEVGFFQLLDENGNIGQGDDSYTIESQVMEIVDTTTIEGITFSNTPLGSNIYKYTIPLSQSIYYSSTTMANFKLTWDAKDISQPGEYVSNIQVTFSVD